ncbi:PREDICTED: putative F-box/kelch-repeat protein At3g24610 [Camelina sativa]|uniref:F-box/kelch-repeat protein At3g24610 n=1 Tax=Camelina sativa TaxID=90675 RepID=A0ABM1QQG2_CAMSA|nr:PREDICTED: putative F-box/kelch-repeat protein At3g24610 [Camelina sativa]
MSSPSTSGFFSSLPDEIVLSCLARVSRLDHASLYLASKWLRSLVVSPELYHVRSLVGCTQNCIYLCLSIPPYLTPTWFCFTPQTLNRPSRLVPIRTHFYQPQEASSVVAFGYGIYVIGGKINGRHTSSVFFLDCRSHTWTTLPSMRVARASAAVGVVDGMSWEVSNISAQFPASGENAVMDEKVFALNGAGRGMFYIPSEGIWKTGNSDTIYVLLCNGWEDTLVYAKELDWRKHEGMVWREVMGLEKLTDTLCDSKLVYYGEKMSESDHSKSWMVRHVLTNELDRLLPGHKLSNSGPNMLLFWDVLGPEKLEVWCAEISLKRCNERVEIRGKIEWSEAVMTFKPPPLHQHHCKLLYSLSLNL